MINEQKENDELENSVNCLVPECSPHIYSEPQLLVLVSGNQFDIIY